MEEASTFGGMVRLIMESGRMEKWMEKDSFIGKMGQFIEVNMKMIWDMAKELWYGN